MKIRKQHISFHADLQGTRGTQTSRTWRKNVGLCFLVHATKRSEGKHCIRKFVLECDITGVTIGRNFAQHIELSFYVKIDIQAQNHTCNINNSWKSINVIANYFTLCLERCKWILCCNQQWDRTNIRNARNVLSSFFLICPLKLYVILPNWLLWFLNVLMWNFNALKLKWNYEKHITVHAISGNNAQIYQQDIYLGEISDHFIQIAC